MIDLPPIHLEKIEILFYIIPDGSDQTQRTTYDDDYDERFCCYYGSSSHEDDEDEDYPASQTQMEVEWRRRTY
jgi:hypothetical protein